MKNMKIRGKLGLGFFLLLVIVLVIALVGIFFISRITRENAYAENNPRARVMMLEEIALEVMNARRMVSIMAFHAGDGEQLNQLERDIDVFRDDVSAVLARYAQSVQTDPRLEGERQEEAINFARVMSDRITQYKDEVIYPMFETARYDPLDGDKIAYLVGRGVEIHGSIESVLTGLSVAARATLDDINYEIDALARLAMWAMGGLTLLAVVAGIGVAIIISGLITKPIRKVVAILGSVAQGNLNVNIDRRNIAKDETGVLTRDVIILVDVIRAIVDDLERMKREFTVAGDFEHRVDTTNYQNSFKEMIEGVHGIVDSQVSDVMTLLNALNSISDGNFRVKIEDLPGKKMILPQTLRAVIANMEAVSNEVGEMIEAAAGKGDLHFHIDADKYKGDWREIMEGLNRIAQAVDGPVIEIMNVMNKLSHGDFSDKVRGDYKGDFLQIKNAVNTTIDTLSGYIDEITETLSFVAKGDLTRNINREFVGNFGVIKDSLNDIAKTLNRTMSEISVASAQVLSGARQISASASDLANGAQEQASSVEELNATIDVISQQTRQNAQNAAEANELSTKSTDNAKEGNEAMKQMLVAMTQIKDSSNNISKIIKVIQDIAFQTNLLALNAAVEAARAGEHGRGFNVVAEEVRTLASRSQESATQTTNLIGDSIGRVESGSSIAEATSVSLDTIVKNASEVSDIIDNISLASTEQAEAIAQISDGLSQISRVVQSNSAVSEETAAASEELNSQAEILQQLVGFFKL